VEALAYCSRTLLVIRLFGAHSYARVEVMLQDCQLFSGRLILLTSR